MDIYSGYNLDILFPSPFDNCPMLGLPGPQRRNIVHGDRENTETKPGKDGRKPPAKQRGFEGFGSEGFTKKNGRIMDYHVVS